MNKQNENGSNLPAVFTFSETNKVTAIIINEQPWFVAKDVASILGFKTTGHLNRLLDDDEKGVHKVDTLGGKQSFSIINESGIYNAIFRSNKPEAKMFRKFVTSEVLPALRKEGMYIGIKLTSLA